MKYLIITSTILYIIISCSNNKSDNELSSIMSKEDSIEFRKTHNILSEKKYLLVESNNFGIIDIDSILLVEKRYSVDGYFIFEQSFWYSDSTYQKVFRFFYKTYNSNGSIKFSYDSLNHFQNNITTKRNNKDVPAHHRVFKTYYDEYGKEKIGYSISNSSIIRKSTYIWLNDSTVVYKFHNDLGQVESHTQSIFDSHKNLIDYRVFSLADGSTNYIALYYYDNLNKKIEELQYTRPKKKKSSLDYLIKPSVEYTSAELKLNMRKIYLYNQQGDEVKYIEYNKDGSISSAVSLSYLYNQSNQTIKKEVIYENLSRDNTITRYKYNKAGLLISFTEKYKEKNTIKRKETYSYNNSGKLIEKIVSYKLGSNDRIITYKYNELGLLSMELINYLSKNQITTFVYTYNNGEGYHIKNSL